MEPAPFITSQRRRLAIGSLLMWVMVAATAATVTIPVIASFLIDDFGISRTQLGGLGLVGGVVSAVVSPSAGRLTDRIGGRNAALVVLGGAAAAALLFAVAPVFGAMFAGALVAAITGAAGNPSTNKLIAAMVEPGRRGGITGLKQTGPQVGSLAAGLLAPWGATVFGWRPTVLAMGVLLALPIPFFVRTIPPDRSRILDAPSPTDPLPAAIWWVAAYGLLLGFGGSATFLLPLFVEESLGQSARVAGTAAALLGGVAIVGRLQWARLVEQKASPAPTLAFLAVSSVVAMSLMLVSIRSGITWMWLGAIVLGLSASSWTSVGAIAVIAIAGPAAAGRASGIVWFGFLAGLGLGPPLYGFTVDRTGSYAPMWWIALGSFTLAAVLALAWMRANRRFQSAEMSA